MHKAEEQITDGQHNRSIQAAWRIVECRFYGGMTVEETAEAFGVSPATIKRDWALARAWLNRELSDD